MIESGLDVTDVWPENYSTNSVQKVWAAKYAARHPNLACLDLSSFKCGHDAPTYGLIDSVIASAGKAYSALHDIDANKPSGSIKIRVKTYAHTLMLLRRSSRIRRRRRSSSTGPCTLKKLELMHALQAKLAATGRNRRPPRLARSRALDRSGVARRGSEQAKAKRSAALNVMRT